MHKNINFSFYSQCTKVIEKDKTWHVLQQLSILYFKILVVSSETVFTQITMGGGREKSPGPLGRNLLKYLRLFFQSFSRGVYNTIHNILQWFPPRLKHFILP